eukprot:s548_g14.t1
MYANRLQKERGYSWPPKLAEHGSRHSLGHMVPGHASEGHDPPVRQAARGRAHRTSSSFPAEAAEADGSRLATRGSEAEQPAASGLRQAARGRAHRTSDCDEESGLAAADRTSEAESPPEAARGGAHRTSDEGFGQADGGRQLLADHGELEPAGVRMFTRRTFRLRHRTVMKSLV